MPRRGVGVSDEHRERIVASNIARGATPAKRCPQCLETKDRSLFGMRGGGRYVKSWCLSCEATATRKRTAASPEKVRAWNRIGSLRRMGLTPDQYEDLAQAQGGVCAICGRVEIGRLGYLYVDHDHETRRIRGLLCSPCNSALGMLGDDPDRMRAAIAYLERDGPHLR